jgi:hypothetical protein
MDIWETNKLVLFIAFVVPGFVSLKTYDLLFPRTTRETSQQLIDAVAYSSINYALLLWPIFAIEKSNIRAAYPSSYIAFYVFVLFIAPVSWACLLRWLRTTQFFQGTLPHPIGKPWDYVFSKRKRYWVIVTLKDGKQIAGRYDSDSFASSAPYPEQIYLQEAWVLNESGGFERPRRDSAGIIILVTEIMTVELFNITEGEGNVEQEAEHGATRATTEGVSTDSPKSPNG